MADNPLGPFEKHPLNPVISSGHETSLFPFKEGIAALVYKDGPEHNTIQYAEDGVNFSIASITELMPTPQLRMSRMRLPIQNMDVASRGEWLISSIRECPIKCTRSWSDLTAT